MALTPLPNTSKTITSPRHLHQQDRFRRGRACATCRQPCRPYRRARWCCARCRSAGRPATARGHVDLRASALRRRSGALLIEMPEILPRKRGAARDARYLSDDAARQPIEDIAPESLIYRDLHDGWRRSCLCAGRRRSRERRAFPAPGTRSSATAAPFSPPTVSPNALKSCTRPMPASSPVVWSGM